MRGYRQLNSKIWAPTSTLFVMVPEAHYRWSPVRRSGTGNYEALFDVYCQVAEVLLLRRTLTGVIEEGFWCCATEDQLPSAKRCYGIDGQSEM